MFLQKYITRFGGKKMEEKKFLDLNGLKIVVNNIENKIDGNKGDISFTDDTTYEPLEETEASS
jgi:hypothetical protein|uniref:Uncharacterized protein n=1 Tax=Siphoviridae sp. ctTC45 TaxID=2827573 RepID=A0A8S5LQM2_9CAUD|nr:MAG TPA: hypothetical protein [Siphoviridae sp. ctTC45]DAU86611.1 MAG TPA: hypothetical protein [Caudoviricetes sp.]